MIIAIRPPIFKSWSTKQSFISPVARLATVSGTLNMNQIRIMSIGEAERKI